MERLREGKGILALDVDVCYEPRSVYLFTRFILFYFSPLWLNRHWLIDAVLQGPAGRWHHSGGEGRRDQAATLKDEDP